MNAISPDDADRLAKEIPFRELIFARQMLVVGELLRDLPPEDRVSPIVGMLMGVVDRGGELRVEVPDTNESKELLKFCRKLTVPLRGALREQKVLMAREKSLSPGGTRVLYRAGLLLRGVFLQQQQLPVLYGDPSAEVPV
ncbi:Ribosomal RNA large subunit methyltransferase M [Serratia fonticola]|uniref:Ribosomal RNA large subunit methyltransferase M n=1 Tax=Serratia fonticola TaxID=47917 RepID=A0A4U9V0N0_SERFO|nr:Ribosomal RNA large subunit methyltransferase M [Serratia fonticola]